MKCHSLLLLTFLLCLSSCELVEALSVSLNPYSPALDSVDKTQWPRYRATLEYDYGDRVEKESFVCIKPQAVTTPKNIMYYFDLDFFRTTTGSIPRDTVYIFPYNPPYKYYYYNELGEVVVEYENGGKSIRKGYGLTFGLDDGSKIAKDYIIDIDCYNCQDLYITGHISVGPLEYNKEYYQDTIGTPFSGLDIMTTSLRGGPNMNPVNLKYLFLPAEDDSLAFSFHFEGELLDLEKLPDSVMFKVRGQIDLYKQYLKSREYTLEYPDYTTCIK